ncbi:MAG TPA: penicillin-binding protein 2 [Gemmatimonadaceae bacterium]|nr:penicillin-binding protein 2 [Gemmatimonadaceae bacterium]
MSFHPNDIARRAQASGIAVVVIFLVLGGAFFRKQVLQNELYALESEKNRLREVPLPAPRGIIYDRRGEVIAENVPGYSVAVLSSSLGELREMLRRLSETVPLTPGQIDRTVRAFQREPARPALVFSDAPFDVVSVLEEHRIDFPGLIIQSAPKRYYPDSIAVASFVGYIGEIAENQLTLPAYQGYKAGQQIGVAGIEHAYENQLRGHEGRRFVEVDAMGRVVREAGARPELLPEAGPALQTNIDLELQRHIVSIFGDSLQGGVVALEPHTGAVLALHSAPSFDPNRFIGGIPAGYWTQLQTDPRRPLYNKAVQGRYPPASTWKLATAVIALQNGVARLDERMPTPCTGAYLFGGRAFACWQRDGHGSIDMRRAIEVSCNVYFYQLGLRVNLHRLVAGGVALGFRDRSGIDIPRENSPIFPYSEPSVDDYFNQRYGPRNWTHAVVLNLAIGQGENSQTVVNMARFYTALATDGMAATPEIVQREPHRVRLFDLTAAQQAGLRAALAGVISAGGTAAGSQIQGLVTAGKTGTAQSGIGRPNHAWFVGFAPFDDPKIVIAVMLEFGERGGRAARVAKSIFEFYLKQTATQIIHVEG